MAHFYGTMTGRGSTATRTGTVSSGMTAHVRGWDVGVKIVAYDHEGVDCFSIVATGGSNDDAARIILGVVKIMDGEDGPAVVFEPSEGSSDTWMLYEAEAWGERQGRAAGSWVVDGNTTRETAQRLLEGLEDGDPAVLDSLPTSPWSGEWAASLSTADVLKRFGVTDEWDGEDDLLAAFEHGYARGVEYQVTVDARAKVCDV